jgi:chromosome segregation ATPase
MRALTLFLLMSVCALARAQAPVEDRGARASAFTDSQQRVEYARQAAEKADAQVRQSERDAGLAEAALRSAKSQYEAAKADADKAKKALAQARSKAAESRRAYEKESAQFDRLRRGAAAQEGGKAR